MFIACYLALIVTVLHTTVVIGAYVMAYLLGHLPLAWSSISQGGNNAPESCFFSLGFNLCAAIFIIMGILRYDQISLAITDAKFPQVKEGTMRLRNKVSLALGYLSGLGISLVGSFQEKNNVVNHTIGAVLSCFCPFVYFVLDTYYSFIFPSLNVSNPVKWVRFTVIFVCFVSSVISLFITLYFLVVDFGNFRPTGYVCATSEWIVFFLYQTYLISFWLTDEYLSWDAKHKENSLFSQ